MPFRLHSILVWILLTLAYEALAEDLPVLVIRDGMTEVPIKGFVEYLEDPDGRWDFSSIQDAQGFQSSKNHSLNWGLTKHPLWLRLHLQDARTVPSPLVLELDYNQIDDLRLQSCQVKDPGDWNCPAAERTEVTQGGRTDASRRRDLAAPSDEYMFPPITNHLTSRYHSIWVRAQSSGSMQLTAKIRTPEAQSVYHREMAMLQGIYTGGLLALVLYNLIVGISLRWVKYLGYVSYMASWIIFQTYLSGYGFIYLDQYLPTMIGSKIIPIGILVFGESALIFALMFLPVKQVAPRFWLVSLIFAISGILIAAAGVFMSYATLIRITIGFYTPVWIILEFGCGIVCLKAQRRTAILFLASWGALAFGSLLVMLRTIGVLPMNFITLYGQQIGSWTEGLLMSLAMADVINQLRKQTNAQAAAINTANLELRRMDQLKDEFLANTSHELKTPLHGILGLTESLLEDGDHRNNPENKRKLSLIVASSRRLMALVNDILDFSKLQHDDLALQQKPLHLSSVVQLVAELLRPSLAHKPVTVQVDIPDPMPMVWADENRLQQILFNLLGNAIKFTLSGTITVRATQNGDSLAVAVIDTGIGIPPEKHQDIFKSFVQAEGSTARKFGGTGLGLTITKKLVELHKGTITVDSKVGIGSTFTFTLPLAQDRTATGETSNAAPDLVVPALVGKVEAQELPTSSNSYERKRILVADDDEVNLEVIRAQLSPEKYELVFARDGNDACRLLEEQGPFDLILCDVMMPYKTGYEVTRTIRETYGQAELPIILLTAKSQLNDLVAGFDSGANDYLTKPFAKKELIARLQNHLIVRQTNNALRRFVPKDFISLLGHERITDVHLGDYANHNLTIFFADIRNFTTIAEKLSADQTFRYVSDCLARMSPYVRSNHGFIDKFIGDAVLAIFPQRPDDALQAAIAIHREVDAYNASQKDSVDFLLNIGIGIHTGTTVLGTVGEPERFDVTVISDAVNIANRIEGVTKLLGIRCALSREAMPSDTGSLAFRRIGSFQLAGKRSKTELLELLDVWDFDQQRRRAQTKAQLEEGIDLFTAGKLAEARQRFETIATINPLDLLVLHYLNACERLIADGMPDNFDGTLSFDKVA